MDNTSTTTTSDGSKQVDLDRSTVHVQSEADFNIRSSTTTIVMESEAGVQVRSSTATQNYVPPPKQVLFDGRNSWESFIKPFESMALSCGWTDHEKHFRLECSLRGQSADYAFNHISPEVRGNYVMLKNALEQRYAEKRTSACYLAELESRKLGLRENLAKYVADIKRLVIKGYPTADEITRGTVGLRHFLKGLPDPQMSVAVGMSNSRDIDEARLALETYKSLCNEVGGEVPRVHNVMEDDSNNAVTEERLQAFGRQINQKIDSKFGRIKKLILKNSCEQGRSLPEKRESDRNGENKNSSKYANVQCYTCYEYGHYSRKCPMNFSDPGGPSAQK